MKSVHGLVGPAPQRVGRYHYNAKAACRRSDEPLAILERDARTPLAEV